MELNQLKEFEAKYINGQPVFRIAHVYKQARLADGTLPEKDPWNHVCLGSDYEGVINTLDIYFYSSDLVSLENRLTAFFINAINNPLRSFDIYREVMEPGKAAEYVKKILWGNSQWFLERYFQADLSGA